VLHHHHNSVSLTYYYTETDKYTLPPVMYCTPRLALRMMRDIYVQATRG